jgi:hypothetical protein
MGCPICCSYPDDKTSRLATGQFLSFLFSYSTSKNFPAPSAPTATVSCRMCPLPGRDAKVSLFSFPPGKNPILFFLFFPDPAAPVRARKVRHIRCPFPKLQGETSIPSFRFPFGSAKVERFFKPAKLFLIIFPLSLPPSPSVNPFPRLGLQRWENFLAFQILRTK